MSILEQIQAAKAQYDQDRDLAKYTQIAGPLVAQLRNDKSIPDNDKIGILYTYDPQSIQAAITSKDAQEYAQKMQGAYGIAQGAVDLTQLATAFSQIKTANTAGRQTVMPSMPAVPGQNQQLSEQLYSAQRRANDVSYITDPINQQLNQGYQQAVGQAQASSGGQAANYQAGANLANFQRMQASLGMAPVIQQARNENQGLVNNLLGQRMQENQNAFDNRMQVTQPALDQFNRKQEAIGALGSQGRTRAFDIISKLPDYLQYLPYDKASNDYAKDTYIKHKAMEQKQAANRPLPKPDPNFFGQYHQPAFQVNQNRWGSPDKYYTQPKQWGN